jgi:hypothetical protein
MFQHLKLYVAVAFSAVGRRSADGHYRAILRHFSTFALGVWFEQLVSTGPEVFHDNEHCLLMRPSLSNVPKLSIVQPKKRQHHFSRRWLCFELLLDRRCRMLPFHTLAFTLRSGMAGQCAVLSDCVTFITMAVQQALVVCHMAGHVLSWELFGTHLAQALWNPSGNSSIVTLDYPESWNGLFHCFPLQWTWTGGLIVLHQ